MMKFGDELVELEGSNVKLARIISRITAAPLINLYVGLIMIIYSPIGLGSILTPFYAFIICLILMVILPVSPIIYEAFRGVVDLDVSIQDMRTRFFLYAILCYIIAFTVYYLTACEIMATLALAYISVTISVMTVNLHSKVSVHTAGIAGPGTALIIVYGMPALIGIIAWLAVLWSRVILKQHSVLQSLVGIVLGVIFTVVAYTIGYTIF